MVTPNKDSERTNEQIYGGDLPEVPFEYGHLPQFLTDIGTVAHGYEGRLVPLTFTEIKAWADLMKINLSVIESSALHKMSASFVEVANNPKSPCPVESDEMRQKINTKNANTWMAIGKPG